MTTPSDASALARALHIAQGQDGMITWSQLDSVGVSRRRLRRLISDEGWSRPYHGAFLLPGAHWLRGPVRAALAHRPRAIVCGLTAARLLDLGGLPAPRPLWTGRITGPNGHDAPPGAAPSTPTSAGATPMSAGATAPSASGTATSAGATEPVHILLPHAMGTVPAISGLVVHRGSCGEDERRLVRRIPMTAVERTLADLVLESDRETAVSLLDSALRRRRVAALDPVRAAMARRAGVVPRRDWFDLVDSRAGSPLETRLRLLLGDADLLPEQLQWPVWTAGEPPDAPPWSQPIARLDLAWPSRLVAAEADGAAFHTTPRALFRDRIRQNLLLGLGWKLLRFTWADVLRSPAYVVATVRRMLRTPTTEQHPSD